MQMIRGPAAALIKGDDQAAYTLLRLGATDIRVDAVAGTHRQALLLAASRR